LKHERATEEIRELAALYALGSLTQHEAHSFEIHMREDCPVCESEFRRFERIVAGMGFAADEAATPDYLRDLLMARIDRENQPAVPAASQTIVSDPKPQPIRSSAPPLIKPIFSQPQPKQQSILAWALTALFALSAGFMYYTWRSEQDTINFLQTKVSADKSDLDSKSDLLEVQSIRINQYDQVLAMAGKPGAKVLRLNGPVTSPSASGEILWDGAEGKFLAFGVLPSAPDGKIYQLWFLSPTAKIPVCTLKLNPKGLFFVSEPIPREAANSTVAVVTLEPDNGSQIPTLPYYAIARVE
jgi:anti-sigma-K factor RskA